MVKAEVVKKARNTLGDGAQDRTRRNVPYYDFGGEEKADVQEMPLLIKPKAVSCP